MDGRSTDKTREIVAGYERRYPQVRLVDNPGRLSSSARNLAIDQSRGEYLVVIDGHCEIPSRTYFQDLVSAFERTHADCLGRPQPLDVSRASTLQKAIAAARNSPLGHHPASYIYSTEELAVPAGSVAVAYRRKVFDRVGKFDPDFDACEDYELNHRIDQAGMKCYLVPSLAVQYHPRDSLAGLFRQLARYGRGRVRMWRKHPESFSLMAFAPAAFFVGVVVGPLVCLGMPVLWYVYGLVDWGLSLGGPRGFDSGGSEREESGPPALVAAGVFGGASGFRLGSDRRIVTSEEHATNEIRSESRRSRVREPYLGRSDGWS